MITVDFSKAKEITKKRLRLEREPLLQEQDVLFQRALETGSSIESIVVEKTRLRDITDMVDQATTIEALKLLKCTKG